MKVFISWSGDHSRQVALILREWLPQVIQTIDPYVSSEDIEKGARWSADIAEKLETTSVGIICVTRENAQKPWINFEAGALSKTVTTSRVIPFLIDLPNADLAGPLTQFQTVHKTEEDVHQLLKTINGAEDRPLSQAVLDSALKMWWPILKENLSRVKVVAVPVVSRGNNEMIQELLETTRQIQRTVAFTSDVMMSVNDEFRMFTDIGRRHGLPETRNSSVKSSASTDASSGWDDVLEQLKLGIKAKGLTVTGTNPATKVIYVQGDSISRDEAIDLAAKYRYVADWGDPPTAGR